MSTGFEPTSSLDLPYSPRLTRAARRLEQAALGHAVGMGGYTTVAQAEVLRSALGLTRHACLLDLGAGGGWPGIHIARRSGCHLVALDIPYAAMRTALSNMQPVRPGRTCAAVMADGGAQPFMPAAFNAIVHADSF